MPKNKLNDFKIPLSFTKLKVVFIGLILSVFSLGILESLNKNEINWKIARNESGEVAWKLLIFIIFISLLSKIFTKTKIFRQLLPLRKEAGIMVFLITVAHAIFHFLKSGALGNTEQMYLQLFKRDWATLMGTIALIIMIPLFFTSCNYAIKKMGVKSWKQLQKLAHIAFILSAIHISFIEYPSHHEIEIGPLAILTLYLSGYTWLFIKKKLK